MAPHTLQELCKTYLADYHSDTTPKTRYCMEIFCGQLIQDFGDISLADLTTDAIRTWLTTQRQHLKPATVHRKYARLSAILRVAVEEYGWLPEHPLRRIRKPSAGHGTVRFLSDQERWTLLAECRRSQNHLLYPFVLLALSTGGRKDEVRTLRWSEVDTEQGLVWFLRTKTHKARTVPLMGEALDVLRALRQPTHLASELVFPARRGSAPLRSFEQAWRKARARAGITNFRFHDLRHTYASYLRGRGILLKSPLVAD